MRLDLDSKCVVTKFAVKSQPNMYLKAFQKNGEEIASTWTSDLDQAILFESVNDAPTTKGVVPVFVWD